MRDDSPFGARRGLLLWTAALLVGACAGPGSVDLAGVRSEEKLPSRDRKLWAMARAESQYLLESGLLCRDPALVDYVNAAEIEFLEKARAHFEGTPWADVVERRRAELEVLP